MRRWRQLLAILAAILVTFLAAAPGGAVGESESDLSSQVKAAFLVKFPSFVEWPAGVFKSDADPIVIGILGEDPFGRAFDEAIVGRKVNRHPLVLKRFRSLEEFQPCAILYVSPSEKNRLPALFKRLGKAPVLTVGDGEEFVREGGMIQFLKEGGKVRFEINLEAARRTGIRISGKLLQVAKVAKK